jgi:hypothetical protein
MKKHLTFSLVLLTIVCSTVTAQLPSYLPADGLVGWWPFNGNANDESGNGNDGVVNGATLSVDRNGNLSSAFNFDGASNSITTIAQLGEGELTISFWEKIDVFSFCYPIGLGINSASNQGFGVGIGGVNNVCGINERTQFAFDGQTGCSNLISSDAILQIDEWYHAVFEYGNGATKIYVNGVLVAASNNLSYSNFSNLVFGIRSDNLFPFDGSLDDIAIYNRALTPQEIQNLYAGSNETVDTGDGAAPLPQGIPYQAAARDAQGQVIADAPVNVRFSLHEGAVDGAVSYSETHALTTNSIGLFNTVFGNGTPEQSAFDSINWAATTKFLQVEIDLGDGYVDMGTTQLLSVPYAFRSDEAARIKNAGLPIFADNAAALAGGLVAGEMYRTASGDLKIVY